MSTSATSAAQGAPSRLGRFELKRVLGRGAQATVWLAWDPRLEREVALKLLATQASGEAIESWLHEARSVSRLAHPNVVPLFEADQHQGRPFMVFEYVNGPTLSALLRSRAGEMRAMGAREAVALMLPVIDVLRAAHAMGLVHRDLKPSNILVDADGRPRVMDFGIAARIDSDCGAGDGAIVGTPGYMSPEAAAGKAPAAAMDIFSFGMTLGEMLAGRPLMRDADPMQTLRRVQQEDVAWPEGAPALDDALRAIVLRAVARLPQQRFGSAEALQQALARWMEPEAAAPAEAAGGSNGTLEFLLRRMRHKTDFPAMSDAVSRIQRVAGSENESLASLSNEILKDVALTNKLLRLVNTAHFSHAGGGSISTVSRAVALVGFAGIRNMALSLVLLEHMHDKAHAGRLKDEFLRALMAGSLANELCPVARDGEEAFIGSMFQNLGRLLTDFYFPEEAQRVRELCAPATGEAASPQAEDKAALQVLGISYEELGVGVARAWGMPDTLQKAMRRPEGEPPARLMERGGERLRWVGHVANRITEAMLNTPPERLGARLADIATKFARPLGLSEQDVRDAAARARQKLSELAQAMNVQVDRHSPARRLLAPAAGATEDTDSLAALHLQATVTGADQPTAQVLAAGEEPPTLVMQRPGQVAETLAAGIQDITNHMVADNFRLNEVLRMILETMYRALGFRRVVFCLRDPKTGCLTGRFGLGEAVESLAPQFRIGLKPATGQALPDLFTAVCLKGADTLIADATAANIAARLPDWYRRGVAAPAFLLLPLMMKNAPFALIYADKAQPGGIALDEKELSLLRTLRNQAVMAFRQSN